MPKTTLKTINDTLLRIERLLEEKPIDEIAVERAKEVFDKDYFVITEVNKKTSEILAECKALFPVWSHFSDEKLDKDFPIPEKLTVKKFKKTIEPDEEFANMSVKDLKKKYPDRQFITLRERLLMEIQYFKETGKHLDIQNVTLCAGSRDSDGLVPTVDWGAGKLYVGWCDSDSARGLLRARSAV
jgi:hypothetical protein